VTNKENATYWCYQFFLYWKNTATGNNDYKVSPSFAKYDSYFKNPSAALALTINEITALIKLYASALQKIILGAPPVKGNDGFHVYKVAGNYEGFPQSPADVPKKVKQLPFNSTTINPHFNFAFFIKDAEAKGNVFDIHIPVGARVLYVPAEFHAYPFEKEIILPFGCQLTITRVFTGKLDYIDAKTEARVILQKPPNAIMMGPVYDTDVYQPCNTGTTCQVKRKNFKTMVAEYAPP